MVRLRASLGTGRKTSGCAGCGEVFTALAGFDKHRRKGTCVPPERAGLVKRANGRWSLPGKSPATTGK